MAFTKLRASALCATGLLLTGMASAQSFSDRLIAKYKNNAGTVEKTGGQILAEALNRPLEGTGYKIPTNFESDIRIDEPRSDAPNNKMTWAGDAGGVDFGGVYVWMNQPKNTPSMSNGQMKQKHPERCFEQVWFGLRGIFQPITTEANDLLRMGVEFDNTLTNELMDTLITSFKTGDFSRDNRALKKAMNGGNTWIILWDQNDALRDLAYLAGQKVEGLVYKDVFAGDEATGRNEVTIKNAKNLAQYLAASMSEMINFKVNGTSRYVVEATGKPIPPKNYEDAKKEYERIKAAGGENLLLQSLTETGLFGRDMLAAHVGQTKNGKFFAMALPKGASRSLDMAHGL